MNLPTPKVTMPAFIVVVLLVYFGIALFGKRIGIDVDQSNPLIQTLINLTIAAASFFIGTSQGSSKKDDIIAGLPPVPPIVPPGTVIATVTPPADSGTPPKDPAS